MNSFRLFQLAKTCLPCGKQAGIALFHLARQLAPLLKVKLLTFSFGPIFFFFRSLAMQLKKACPFPARMVLSGWHSGGPSIGQKTPDFRFNPKSLNEFYIKKVDKMIWDILSGIDI